MAYAVELILARQLASGLSVPVLIVDARGDTVFYPDHSDEQIDGLVANASQMRRGGTVRGANEGVVLEV